jgi:hypothetical protein
MVSELLGFSEVSFRLVLFALALVDDAAEMVRMVLSYDVSHLWLAIETPDLSLLATHFRIVSRATAQIKN